MHNFSPARYAPFTHDQISDLLLHGRVVSRLDGLLPSAKDCIIFDKANASSNSPMVLMWHSVDLTNGTQFISLLAQKLGLVRGIQRN